MSSGQLSKVLPHPRSLGMNLCKLSWPTQNLDWTIEDFGLEFYKSVAALV